MAEEIGAEGKIQVQATRYEGFTVLANALIESAGTRVLKGPDEVDLAEGPTSRALEVMGQLANSPAAATDIDTSTEDTGRLAFQDGTASFMTNYPFVYPSAEAESPDVFKQMEAARYPAVDAGQPEQAAAGRDQPRDQRLLGEQGGGLRGRRVPAQRAQPGDLGKPRRTAPGAQRPL